MLRSQSLCNCHYSFAVETISIDYSTACHKNIRIFLLATQVLSHEIQWRQTITKQLTNLNVKLIFQNKFSQYKHILKQCRSICLTTTQNNVEEQKILLTIASKHMQHTSCDPPTLLCRPSVMRFMEGLNQARISWHHFHQLLLPHLLLDELYFGNYCRVLPDLA